MAEKNNTENIRLKSWLRFFSITATVILLAVLSSFLKIRIDLTEDKRYTLSEPTKKILHGLKNDMFVQVYLEGEMPIPFKRLKRSVNDILDEFRISSGRKIDYEFVNPAKGKDLAEREEFFQSLAEKGLNPVNIRAGDEEGGSSQKIIFPGMIINYNGAEVPVNFLRNNQSVTAEMNLLHSIEGLEYEMIQTIYTLTADTVYKVAFIEGHNEKSEVEVADLTLNLARYFTIDRGVIGGKPGVLDDYTAVVIAGPESEFSEADKFVLDQYIMKGGRVLWLIEEVAVNTDSLVYGETVALYRPLNLQDMLFRYGARVNPAVVQDIDCMLIGLTVMSGGVRQQVVPAPWVYYPLLTPSPDHPITRNINKVKGEFVNYIDTVGLDKNITKKILLRTSAYSRTLNPPLLISLKEAEIAPEEKDFNMSGLPVAVLLEGKFPSAFRNRITSSLVPDKNFNVRTESVPGKMIVIADGDIIRNEVRRSGTEEIPYPLGLDRYTGQMFGNRDFLINCLNYLADDIGLMELRARELKLRLLDKSRIKSERLKWQIVNVAGPAVIVLLAGLIYSVVRKRLYTRR
ncbi:MAG: gliding motility-associated ABC transporter substrate-binding protein GldG [Bacteroidales bacterium]|nr:gliding motility-associated ABC transporter substrate-binding protein GldG [Bacteroidales bacterium]